VIHPEVIRAAAARRAELVREPTRRARVRSAK